MKITEVDLGKRVVEYLNTFPGWEIFQEVRLGYGHKRPDIVVKIPYKSTHVYWIIECKLRLNCSVLEQAMYHRNRINAEYVSVAVMKGSSFIEQICRDYGIGILLGSDMFETLRPKMLRRRKRGFLDIEKYLMDAQKESLAGSQSGYVTPFNQTCQNISWYLKSNPGASIKDVIKHVDYHWSTPATAYNCIAHWVKEGVLHGVRYERRGRNIVLFAQESK